MTMKNCFFISGIRRKSLNPLGRIRSVHLFLRRLFFLYSPEICIANESGHKRINRKKRRKNRNAKSPSSISRSKKNFVAPRIEWASERASELWASYSQYALPRFNMSWLLLFSRDRSSFSYTQEEEVGSSFLFFSSQKTFRQQERRKRNPSCAAFVRSFAYFVPFSHFFSGIFTSSFFLP